MTPEIINGVAVPTIPIWLIVIVIIWSLIWKGIALWKAARLEHRRWFVVLLVLNTLGILEIIYIYAVARKYTVEVIQKSENSKSS